MNALRLAAIFSVSSFCLLAQTSGAAEQVITSSSRDFQVESKKAQSEPKVVVMYMGGVSEKDKARVHSVIHAGNVMKISDSAEEITIVVPMNQDGKKYVEHVLADANKDPAVFKAYRSQSYALQ